MKRLDALNASICNAPVLQPIGPVSRANPDSLGRLLAQSRRWHDDGKQEKDKILRGMKEILSQRAYLETVLRDIENGLAKTG